MKWVKLLSILVATAVLVFVCLPVISAEICNRVVAQVNSDVITLYELNTRIKEFTGFDPNDLKMRNEEEFLEIRRKVLDLIVDEKIVREKILELGIKVTSEEVDAAIERVKKSNNVTQEELLASLENQEMTYESYRERIKEDLERMRVINLEVRSKIIIREEAIKEYYDKNKDKFSTPEKIHLATIFLKQEDPSNQDEAIALYRKGEKIVSKLRNGEDFGEMARKFSQGPGANEGGDLGFFKSSQLDPDLTKVIKGMSPGDISRPIMRPAGIQIISLVERHGGRVKSFEKVRDAIFEILYREEIDLRYSSWIKKLRETAYTKIIF